MELRGIAASDGYASGTAYVLPTFELTINRQLIEPEEIESEIARLERAVDMAVRDITNLKEAAALANREEQVHIFATHLSLIRDPEYMGEVVERIQNDSLHAEAALSDVTEELIAVFSGMNNELMKERCMDLRDVSYRTWSYLSGNEQSFEMNDSEPVIMIGKDITPSITATLNRNQVAGIGVEVGGKTSHSAIIARSLGIPAVVGISGLMTSVVTGDLLILDGYKGVVFHNPDAKTLEAYRQLQLEEAARMKQLEKFKDAPTTTIDGHRVQLAINIASPNEAQSVSAVGAEGIGLYRSEFLFMGRDHSPSEDEQYEAYKAAVLQLKDNQPILIRTLDAGGDKEVPYLQTGAELNPFLGYRAIRICLSEEYSQLFKTQLRAILRASAYGDVKIMFPMISTLQELRAAKCVLEQVKNELAQSGVAFDADLEVGIMIEVPAAAIMADQLAREVDFFSIGTNDLVQYTMAADRMNEKVAYLSQPMNPAILRLIDRVIQAAHENHIWVGMCGEMASNPIAIPLLVGLGLDEFSMSASAILPSRKLISQLNYEELRLISQHTLQLETAEDIEAYVMNVLSNLN